MSNRLVSDSKDSEGHDASYPGTPSLDVDKYRKYVDHLDITEQRKIELLQTLWSIMYAFVQVGYGVDSIQRFIPALKEISSEPESSELEESTNAQQLSGAASEEKDD